MELKKSAHFNLAKSDLLKEFPQSKSTVTGLLNYFASAPKNALTPVNVIFFLLRDENTRTLVIILNRMREVGLIKGGFFVANPDSAFLVGPYNSLIDIPNVHKMSDGSIGSVVLLEHVQLAYTTQNL